MQKYRGSVPLKSDGDLKYDNSEILQQNGESKTVLT
jgi:hypothetical protein